MRSFREWLEYRLCLRLCTWLSAFFLGLSVCFMLVCVCVNSYPFVIDQLHLLFVFFKWHKLIKSLQNTFILCWILMTDLFHLLSIFPNLNLILILLSRFYLMNPSFSLLRMLQFCMPSALRYTYSSGYNAINILYYYCY